MPESASETQKGRVNETQSIEAETPESTPGPEAADGPADEKDQLASLEAQLEAALQKSQENWELALRTQAELENLRKRTQRDIEAAHKYALERLATELLAVRDSMELGLSAAQDSSDIKSLREGMELTLKILSQAMEKFDIREINPGKEKFNPELHQAMALQESEKLEPNTVISVMQKGYMLKDRLLRPALVTVAKAPAGDSQ